jgi:hypothetical protein
MSELAIRVLSLAATQIGVRETSHNRSREIDGYNRDIGHDPTKADPWCAIFVCAMVKRACDALGLHVPIHLTAGVFTLDERAPPAMLQAHPEAGCIFILNGHKHTGLVEGVIPDTGVLMTIEGNTNDAGSHEGDGVYRRKRKPTEICGYINLNRSP